MKDLCTKLFPRENCPILDNSLSYKLTTRSTTFFHSCLFSNNKSKGKKRSENYKWKQKAEGKREWQRKIKRYQWWGASNKKGWKRKEREQEEGKGASQKKERSKNKTQKWKKKESRKKEVKKMKRRKQEGRKKESEQKRNERSD